MRLTLDVLKDWGTAPLLLMKCVGGNPYRLSCQEVQGGKGENP